MIVLVLLELRPRRLALTGFYSRACVHLRQIVRDRRVSDVAARAGVAVGGKPVAEGSSGTPLRALVGRASRGLGFELGARSRVINRVPRSIVARAAVALAPANIEKPAAGAVGAEEARRICGPGGSLERFVRSPLARIDRCYGSGGPCVPVRALPTRAHPNVEKRAGVFRRTRRRAAVLGRPLRDALGRDGAGP